MGDQPVPKELREPRSQATSRCIEILLGGQSLQVAIGVVPAISPAAVVQWNWRQLGAGKTLP